MSSTSSSAVWRALGNPRVFAAPMVDVSDLAWRELMTRYGKVDVLCTQMLHAGTLLKTVTFRATHATILPEWRGSWGEKGSEGAGKGEGVALGGIAEGGGGEEGGDDGDGSGTRRLPLVTQIAGGDPEVVARAAVLVAPYSDMVDLNFGCPQAVARRGPYGAFVVEPARREQMVAIIRATKAALASLPRPVPLMCKIRLLPSLEASLKLVKDVEEAGADVLCVHGRTRKNKGENTTRADWEAIRLVKEAVRLPVIANGGILSYDDVEKCISSTGVDAVMVGCGVLDSVGMLKPQLGGKDKEEVVVASPPSPPSTPTPSPPSPLPLSPASSSLDALEALLVLARDVTGSSLGQLMGHIMAFAFLGMYSYPLVRVMMSASLEDVRTRIRKLATALDDEGVTTSLLVTAGGDLEEARRLATLPIDHPDRTRRVEFAPCVSALDFDRRSLEVTTDLPPLSTLPTDELHSFFTSPHCPPLDVPESRSTRRTRRVSGLCKALQWHAPHVKPHALLAEAYTLFLDTTQELKRRIAKDGPIRVWVQPEMDVVKEKPDGRPESDKIATSYATMRHENRMAGDTDASAKDGFWFTFPHDGGGKYFRYRFEDIPIREPTPEREELKVLIKTTIDAKKEERRKRGGEGVVEEEKEAKEEEEEEEEMEEESGGGEEGVVG